MRVNAYLWVVWGYGYWEPISPFRLSPSMISNFAANDEDIFEDLRRKENYARKA
jgi:hypothetical protein